MRARFIILACMALAVSPCLATDPPAPKPVIILPVAPAPTPVPNPMPGPPQTVTKLEKGARYVVRASKQCDMVISPEGLVEIEEKKGPRDWTAIFAGGTGDYEDRHYDDPFLYSVKATGTGTVKITFIPRGYTTKAEWVEATIEANNGPRPPDPKPPEPKPPEPAKSFRVIFVHETAKPLTAAQNAVIYGKVVEEYLTKNATGGKAGWKRRDPNTPSEPGVMGDLWTAAKAELKPTDPPCVVVEKNGKVEIIPVAATPEAMVSVFDEYLKGGK